MSNTARKGEIGAGLFRTGRFILISGAYLILYVWFRGLSPKLHSFSEGAVWNLPAGLSLGLLLGYGLPYVPVVFLAQVLAPLRTDIISLSAPYLVILASIKTGVYVAATLAIRKLTNQSYIDLANPKTFGIFFLLLPVIAGLNSGVLILDSAVTGWNSWTHEKGLLLPEILANMCGIVLITPFVLVTARWERARAWLDKLSGNSSPTGSMGRQNPFIRCLLLLVAMAGCLYVLFGLHISDGFLLFSLISVPLITLSLAFGLRGVTPLLFVVGIFVSSKAQGNQWSSVETQLVIFAAGMNSILIGRLSSEGKQRQRTISRQAAMMNSVSFV